MMKEEENPDLIISGPTYSDENNDPNVATVRIGTTRPETDAELAARRAKQDALRKDFEAGKLDKRKKKGLLGWGDKLGFLGGKRRTKRRRKKRRTRKRRKTKRIRRKKRRGKSSKKRRRRNRRRK